MQYSQKWDLDCFSGGSHSKDFSNELVRLSTKIGSLKPVADAKSAPALIKTMQEIDLALGECDSFIGCLQAQNVKDERANQLPP